MIRTFPRLCLALGLAVSTAAGAEDTPDQLFNQGRALLAAKNYAAACPLLERSHQLEPALGTLLNVADCLENSGKPASAYRRFNEAAAWAARLKESKREQVASKRAQTLKGKLTFVSVELAQPAPQAIVRIVPADPARKDPPEQWPLDGTPQSAPLDPGAYQLRIEAPGRIAHEQRFEVGAGARVLKLSVPALEPEPSAVAEPSLAVLPPPLPPPALVTIDKPGLSATTIVEIVNFSVGGALVVASVVGLAYSRVVLDRVDRQQPGGPDEANPTVTRGEFNTVRVLYPVSWAGLGVGVAAIATGTILLIRDARAPRVTVTVLPMAEGAFASVGGTF